MSRIDVHHHFHPPAYSESLAKSRGIEDQHFDPLVIEHDRALCNSIGVKTAILSATSPGPTVETDPLKAAQLARAINQEGARIRDSDPVHYGFFASLPSLFETKLCLQELEHAFDVLHADGVIIFTRYDAPSDGQERLDSDGPHYLGHPAFKPVWEELNRRKSVVLIHPTMACDPSLANSNLPQFSFDYPHETGRTAMDLILSGALRSVPNCKLILSHAGGTLPWLLYRTAGLFLQPELGNKAGLSFEEIEESAKTFYVDTALASHRTTFSLLREFMEPGHILFGSDASFPNAADEALRFFSKCLDEMELQKEEKESVDYAGALELFPRLKDIYTSGE
ncbi:hypothetical protein BT69DRAFT_1221448 [Atractiella rhizophila]|nr:hypothetical protein BT69DRAFT_1221448 [Atractiella rhizophila]